MDLLNEIFHWISLKEIKISHNIEFCWSISEGNMFPQNLLVGFSLLIIHSKLEKCVLQNIYHLGHQVQEAYDDVWIIGEIDCLKNSLLLESIKPGRYDCKNIQLPRNEEKWFCWKHLSHQIIQPWVVLLILLFIDLYELVSSNIVQNSMFQWLWIWFEETRIELVYQTRK